MAETKYGNFELCRYLFFHDTQTALQLPDNSITEKGAGMLILSDSLNQTCCCCCVVSLHLLLLDSQPSDKAKDTGSDEGDSHGRLPRGVCCCGLHIYPSSLPGSMWAWP